jgi:hypothetical protein
VAGGLATLPGADKGIVWPLEIPGHVAGRSARVFTKVSNYGNRQGRAQHPERRNASPLTNTRSTAQPAESPF